MSEHKTLLVTRPTVAMELTNLGHTPTVRPHPWKPGLTAWVYTLDEDTTADALKLYTAMGIRIPEPLAQAAERMAAHE